MEMTTVALAWIAGSVLIVPLTGITARFGLRPLVDAVARLRRAGRDDDDGDGDGATEALEERVEALARAVERLATAVEQGRKS